MMSLLEYYHYVNTEIADPRTSNWILINSPVPLLLITLAYLYYVLKYGPEYMKDRPPYKFHTFIRIYNTFQIVANAWVVYAFFEAGWYQDYFIYCAKFDYSSSPQNLKFLNISWYLMCLRLVDYIETCLFVLRKKHRQISFLHVYHHVSTLWIGWVFHKYFVSGTVILPALLNCCVHVMMYTYYLLSSFGPTMQKLTNAVKPAVTTIQIIQFWVILLHGIQAFAPSCSGVKIQAVIGLSNVLINLILFLNFYKENYSKKAKQVQYKK